MQVNMSGNWIRRRVAPLALLLLAVASCNDITPTAVPNFEVQAAKSTSTSSYTVIEESLPKDLLPGVSLSAIIGITGGNISLAGHVLHVPAGAVTVPTLFTMVVPLNGYVEVDLSATVTDILGNVIQVTKFSKPLTLTLTYARAKTNVTDPSRLFIAYMPNGDHSKLEKLPSTVSTTNLTVSAKLDHFSKYCMATD